MISPPWEVLVKEGKALNVRILNLPLNVTSWNVLYYRLQANYDGLRSEYCPALINAPSSDGEALYLLGKRQTRVTSTDQLAAVELSDLHAGGSQTIHADLFIVADGQNSIIHPQFMPDDAKQPYSGYIVWRGMVPEKNVSEATKKLFDERLNVFAISRGYGVSERPTVIWTPPLLDVAGEFRINKNHTKAECGSPSLNLSAEKGSRRASSRYVAFKDFANSPGGRRLMN
ncbi:hypothetical protein MMC29_003346 [Sticta canariensis]|nr:hypothetical protein [Sticta canariensis]